MVLFSSHIGFDIVIWIDIFCQIANVAITALIRIPFCRKLWIAQAGTFVYGVANATSNVFHSYAYCVFDKDMFVRISGWTRGATLVGHMVGSFVGWIVWTLAFSELNNLYKISQKEAKSQMTKIVDGTLTFFPFYKEVYSQLTMKLFNGVVVMLILTIGFMFCALVVSFFFPKLSKEAKRKNKKSVSESLKNMLYATKEFKNRSVAFWALAWMLSFMSMLYSKQWCPNLWKFHQERLSEPIGNSVGDAGAYIGGALGSFAPGIITKHVGFQGSIAIQLVLTGVGAVLAILQYFNLPSISLYYIIHAAFSFIIYYSMAFQSGELARSMSHDKIKPLFYILNASTFLLQCILNFFFDGVGMMPSMHFVKKYLVMTGFMIFNFLLIFVGFSGAKREVSADHKRVEQPSKPSTPLTTSAGKLADSASTASSSSNDQDEKEDIDQSESNNDNNSNINEEEKAVKAEQ